MVPTPNPENATLDDVAVLSARNVWAVGYEGSQETSTPRIEHWDGVRWEIVPSPHVTGAELDGAAAVSSSDVWAVGTILGPRTLIEHWDGVSWTIVSSDVSNVVLVAVSAASGHAVWAVGWLYEQNGDARSVALRWDGTRWIDASPRGAGLFGVAARADKDVWAVGEDAEVFTVAQRWNGTRWKTYRSPIGAPHGISNGYDLFDVAAFSDGTVWAVGAGGGGRENVYSAVVHWNGKRWSTRFRRGTELRGLAAISHRDLWAVGYRSNSSEQRLAPFITHWNGQRWRDVAAPNGITFSAAAAVSARDVWAVGERANQQTAAVAHYACA